MHGKHGLHFEAVDSELFSKEQHERWRWKQAVQRTPQHSFWRFVPISFTPHNPLAVCWLFACCAGRVHRACIDYIACKMHNASSLCLWAISNMSAETQAQTRTENCSHEQCMQPYALRKMRRMKKWIESPPNFERLVLGCVEANFCNWILVRKLLTRSTRFTYFCTAQTSIVQQNASSCFAISKMKFWKFFVHHVLSFLCLMLNIECSWFFRKNRNFASVFRKWNTII